jgi:DNA-directed RNA polymerase subunit RPC12/RpoP
MGYRCERCSHEWVPRDFNSEPRVCPKCKSPYWDRPRKQTTMTTYEDFRDLIRQTLRNGRRLTWTEIRTETKLPQSFPNNQWVRRLEQDIGLERIRDAHGIIHWGLRPDAAAESSAIAKRVGKAASRKQGGVE